MQSVISRVARRIFGNALADYPRLPCVESQGDAGPRGNVWRRDESGGAAVRRRGTRFFDKPDAWANVGARWRNHVWSYGVLVIRAQDGLAYETLVVVDDFTGACLAIRPERRLAVEKVVDIFAELIARRGAPARINAVHDHAGLAAGLRRWLSTAAPATRFTEGASGVAEPGRPEFNELLWRRAFVQVDEVVQALAETWRAAIEAKLASGDEALWESPEPVARTAA